MITTTQQSLAQALRCFADCLAPLTDSSSLKNSFSRELHPGHPIPPLGPRGTSRLRSPLQLSLGSSFGPQVLCQRAGICRGGSRPLHLAFALSPAGVADGHHFGLSISLLLVATRTEQPFSALRTKGPRHDPAARPVRRALRRWRSLGAAFVREGGNGPIASVSDR